ncbi:unnamed protein product [Ambrosiozyma monospora]|uniref:Unnamed protein product n=1 Tax=Ambrosiozyma monospora TaxID=43982 RepID=A0ACB5T538_AMBMO|nr:unnamed protein product [Ambrosiozyma monospora]
MEVDMADLPTGKSLSEKESKSVLKPDLLVVLNPLDCQVALKEALQASIPTVGLVDTNCDVNLVTYPIPANDDSIRATNLICGVLGKAGEIGYQRRLEKVAAYKASLGLDVNAPFNNAENEIDEDEFADQENENEVANVDATKKTENAASSN